MIASPGYTPMRFGRTAASSVPVHPIYISIRRSRGARRCALRRRYDMFEVFDIPAEDEAAGCVERGLTAAKGPLGFGEHRLDRFFGPLEPGRVALLESTSPFVFDIMYLVLVNALKEPGAQVVFVDGCNRINPYVIVNLCKRYGLRADAALDRVHICRAFTAYQMSSIIEDQLEQQCRGARLLIASGLQKPYQDKDVWHKEADVLVRRAAQQVRAVTKRCRLVTLITDLSLGAGGADFRPHLIEASHRYLRLSRLPKKLRLHDEDMAESLDYLPVPLNQSILDEFWEVL